VLAGASSLSFAPPHDVGRTEAGERGVLCLMYHRFVDDRDFSSLPRREQDYAIGIEKFGRQLRMLREAGYRSLSLDEALAFVRGKLALDGPAVLITIDDGCRSALTRAAPILKKYGMTATLFVTTDASAYVFCPGATGRDVRTSGAGESDACDPKLRDEELRTWVSMGFDVGSHGVSHRPLIDLNDAELRFELEESKAALERVLGARLAAISVPCGRHDQRVRRLALDAGYQAIFTSEKGLFRRGDPLSQLHRMNVSGRWSDEKTQRVLTLQRTK
jgi:peptidoglycan/xylan/chitin deacetylase (PgdA/CDA1 family)